MNLFPSQESSMGRLGGAIQFKDSMAPAMPDFGALPESSAIAPSANVSSPASQPEVKQAPADDPMIKKFLEGRKSGKYDENGLRKDGKMFRGPEARLFVAQNGGKDVVLKDKKLAAELNRITIAENRKLGGLDPLPEPEATPPQADIKDVFGAHKEYYDQSKQYHLMGQALNKMLKSVQMDSAAGDLGLIFGLMKALDPTSVVRESEQASAENAAGVPERIRNLYNKLINGERLSPKQRMDFLRQAQGMFQALEEEQAVRDKYFTGYAQRHGMNVEDVVANPYLELNNKVQDYFNKFNADPNNRKLIEGTTIDPNNPVASAAQAAGVPNTPAPASAPMPVPNSGNTTLPPPPKGFNIVNP